MRSLLMWTAVTAAAVPGAIAGENPKLSRELQRTTGIGMVDVIVQFARNARAFFFLCGEQPASHFSDARNTGVQC